MIKDGHINTPMFDLRPSSQEPRLKTELVSKNYTAMANNAPTELTKGHAETAGHKEPEKVRVVSKRMGILQASLV